MNKKPLTFEENSPSIEYIPFVLRSNCWFPLGPHHVGKTPDEAKKKLERYTQVTKTLQERHPGLEGPIKATMIMKCTKVVKCQYEEIDV